MTDDIPEPDRVEGAPHPRETLRLIGQAGAQAAWAAAEAAGRRHHAWLLGGPRGVGKATLAWAIARHVIAGRRGPLGPADPSDPLVRRTIALSDPRLLLLRRPWDAKAERLKTEITVEEVRRLRGFLQLSAPDGGARAVIVDAAEDMSVAAANALLKLLEEPPPLTVFLLVSHQPARLLPTIRSRCRDLRCAPLAPAELAAVLHAVGAAGGDDPALAALAGGSAGEALRLLAGGGPAAYGEIVGLLATLPRLDRPALVRLAEAAGGRDGAARFDLLVRLLPLALGRLARGGANGDPGEEAAAGEAALIARLAPDAAAARLWAETAVRAAGRLARARAVNLDPAQAMLDTFLDIEMAAGRLSAAA